MSAAALLLLWRGKREMKLLEKCCGSSTKNKQGKGKKNMRTRATTENKSKKNNRTQR